MSVSKGTGDDERDFRLYPSDETNGDGKALQKLFEKISADLVQKVFQNMEQEEMKKLEISLQKILDNLG